MEKDLIKIQDLAKERESENWEFRTFLKGYAGKNLDSMVHTLFRLFSESIDCTTCGNCCKDIKPVLGKNDIKALSEALCISPTRFKKEYMQKDKEGENVFKSLPCPFLSDNKCLHYEARPADCKSFPHIHKKHFTSRLIGVVQNYSICPIIFNVYEELKDSFKNDFLLFQDIYQ